MEPEEVLGVELASPHSQRWMGYFDLHPKRHQLRVGGGGDEDIFDQFARAADAEENDDAPRRSGVTESIIFRKFTKAPCLFLKNGGNRDG
jgi:hypothetical protein